MQSEPIQLSDGKDRSIATAAIDPSLMARKLSRSMLNTVATYRLIEPNDKILVAISGGKDSYTLLDLLWRARRKAPFQFDLVAVHLDQAQPGYDGTALESWLAQLGAPYEILHEDTFSVVMEHSRQTSETTFCRVCSRLRRGILYAAAERLGCNKIALGHHRDDALETLMLNLCYSGRLQAMPATYLTNDERFHVIRPLIECAEANIATHAAHARYPIVPCNLCGSQTNLKRVEMAQLLAELEQRIPNLRQVMLAALKNVRPSHLLDSEVAEAWGQQADQYPPRR
jgi:tRNA 2-thiocytidine biosynthesis protein TtcA